MNPVKDLNDFADLLNNVKTLIEENPEDFPHYLRQAPRRLSKVPCRGSRTQDWWSGAWESECGYGAEFDCSECCCNHGHLDPRLYSYRNNTKADLKRARISRRFSTRRL